MNSWTTKPDPVGRFWEATTTLLKMGTSSPPRQMEIGGEVIPFVWPDEKVAIVVQDSQAAGLDDTWQVVNLRSENADMVLRRLAGAIKERLEPREGSWATSEAPFWQATVSLMMVAGIRAPTLDYQIRNSRGMMLTAPLSWPDAQMAVVPTMMNPAGFVEEGWRVFTPDGLEYLDWTETLANAVFEVRVWDSGETGINSSKPEQALTLAFEQNGIHGYDRNYKVTNKFGETVGVPDFAWPSEMFIVEVNGYYHTSGRGLDTLVKEAAALDDGRKRLMRDDKDRYTKDLIKIRQYLRLGWMVVVYEADEVMDTARMPEIISEIAAIRARWAERNSET